MARMDSTVAQHITHCDSAIAALTSAARSQLSSTIRSLPQPVRKQLGCLFGFLQQVIMPRRKRNATGGLVFHVLNRAVARDKIFRKQGDYAAFEQILQEAREIVTM